VVIDARWALVTSANFTEATQERNFEAGVLLDHRALARTLVGQFQGLRDRRCVSQDDSGEPSGAARRAILPPR